MFQIMLHVVYFYFLNVDVKDRSTYHFLPNSVLYRVRQINVQLEISWGLNHANSNEVMKSALINEDILIYFLLPVIPQVAYDFVF